MEFVCDSKYIILPASFEAQKKRLLFYIDGEVAFDLVVALDNYAPDFRFPINVERFMGKTISLECEPEVNISFEKSDLPEADYDGKYRPLVHFTAKRGWINDPNGLTFYKGKYLMYFQHNPAATTWENMHWGAAKSDDLIHWEEYGDVLFPDEDGTIFSGSAIIDRENKSGLKNGEEDVILYYYTCAGNTSRASKGKKFTQRIAYSNDGGRTLIKLEKPAIDFVTGENRDPKIVYYEQGDFYVIPIYLDGHEFAFFKSEDLLNWREFQRIEMSEDAECPDFYPLRTRENEIKWVLSAASDRYYIGSFDGDKYVPETDLQRLHYGNASYAAQSWSDLSGGRRVRTAFAKTVIPGMPFGCCMNVPQEMSLKRINGRLQLCASPVEELNVLRLNTLNYENVSIDSGNSFACRINNRAVLLSAEFEDRESFEISLYGLDIKYDGINSELKCADCMAPVSSIDGRVKITVIYDTVYSEIFAQDGSVFMGMAYIQDSMLHNLEIRSESALAIKISISELKSYHGK